MEYLFSILPSILSGLQMSLGVFFITIIGSIPLGILVALGTKSQYFSIRWILNVYITIMRGTPLLLQLVFVYFGLAMVGISLPRFPAAALTFILNYAAYLAEVFRGGFQAVPKGQFEAAQVLGFNKIQTFTKIILAQIVKIVLPSFGNEVVNLVKDTSLVYVIGLFDILRAGSVAASRDVTLVPYFIVAVIYLAMTGLVVLCLRLLEKRFNRWR